MRHDVVVLDVMMFGMSGIEAAGSLRARLTARGTRLVFMSVEPDALQAAERAFGDKATYLRKPVEPDVLLGAAWR
ncbi:MAG: response regulator [Candidatus Sericytochromatia bacterium]|uniref:Response regulator n=1 Tax=Candidatus Tanganyikabacteria bacterium TaxID=2961651 RepID=A0A937X492_9BACT|nr:response regulator [Candidatus Tanganyikabacteria bacterium]